MQIQFKRPYGAYNIGERAGFAPEHAQAIISKGAAFAVKAVAAAVQDVEQVETAAPVVEIVQPQRRKRGR